MPTRVRATSTSRICLGRRGFIYTDAMKDSGRAGWGWCDESGAFDFGVYGSSMRHKSTSTSLRATPCDEQRPLEGTRGRVAACPCTSTIRLSNFRCGRGGHERRVCRRSSRTFSTCPRHTTTSWYRFGFRPPRTWERMRCREATSTSTWLGQLILRAADLLVPRARRPWGPLSIRLQGVWQLTRAH